MQVIKPANSRHSIVISDQNQSHGADSQSAVLLNMKDRGSRFHWFGLYDFYVLFFDLADFSHLEVVTN